MVFAVVERTIASLLKDIVGNVQQIIRAEVRLAKVEVAEELSKARFHLAQSQEQTKQREKVVNELADRFRLLSQQKREAQQAETQRASREKFMRDNNQFVTMDKARTHVRQGF